MNYQGFPKIYTAVKGSDEQVADCIYIDFLFKKGKAGTQCPLEDGRSHLGQPAIFVPFPCVTNVSLAVLLLVAERRE